jgi:hypothetical protein
MKKVLVLSFSNIARDPRVLRQVQWLSGQVELSVAGYGVPPASFSGNWIKLEKWKKRPWHQKWRVFYEIPLRALLVWIGSFERLYWMNPVHRAALEQLHGGAYDLIVANDLDVLPLSIELAKEGQAKILFDAHEFKAGQKSDGRWLERLRRTARFWDGIARICIPRADGMFTVCEGSRDLHEKLYGKRALVLTNAPAREQLSPSPLVAGKVRMVHHGAAGRTRRIEDMVLTVRRLDERFSLDLYLMAEDASSKAYVEQLKALAEGDSRIRFHPPMPPVELGRGANGYDVGLYLLPPLNLNQALALPNKLFEFIQSRLAIVIGPSQEMAKVVRKYDCGWVAPDFSVESLVRTLSAIDEKELAHKKACSDVAAQYECAEVNRSTFTQEASRLLGIMLS